MIMSILATLISLAMMLTGVGGEGQPAEASRTLLLHNVSLTLNGEQINIGPEARLGAYTNGEKAVFDFRTELDGEALLPIQLSVDAEGATALFANADVAVKVTADALKGIEEQINGMLEGAISQGGQSELVTYVVDKFIPAYAALMSAAQDEEFTEQLNQKIEPLVYEIIDRGEGTPVTELIEGESYELTRYSYTVDNDQLIQVLNTIIDNEEVFKDYFDALFGMYALMPEESGFNGITGFEDLYGENGVKMTMEIEEMVSDDGSVNLTEGQLTMDMNPFIARMAQAQGDESGEIPEMPPMVMDFSGVEIDGESEGLMNFDYEFDEIAMEMSIHFLQDEESTSMDMEIEASEEGETKFDMIVTDYRENAGSFNFSYSVEVPDQADVVLSVIGTSSEDGTCAANVTVDGVVEEQEFEFSFDLDVLGDAIEDAAGAHEPSLLIEDLSEEGLSALSQDQTAGGVLMQVLGSLTVDAQKLMADEGVQALTAMAQTDSGEYDYTFDAEGFEGEEILEVPDEEPAEAEYAEEPVEDDGVLPFEMPEFGWLPEGWSVQQSDADTAYDWVDMTIGDESGENSIYAIFFDDSDNAQSSYMVSDNGGITPVEGRQVSISDLGDGAVSVSMNEGNVFVNLMFNTAETLELETVGKIVAGLKF